jgi:hypothetical protein
VVHGFSSETKSLKRVRQVWVSDHCDHRHEQTDVLAGTGSILVEPELFPPLAPSCVTLHLMEFENCLSSTQILTEAAQNQTEDFDGTHNQTFFFKQASVHYASFR